MPIASEIWLELKANHLEIQYMMMTGKIFQNFGQHREALGCNAEQPVLRGDGQTQDASDHWNTVWEERDSSLRIPVGKVLQVYWDDFRFWKNRLPQP